MAGRISAAAQEFQGTMAGQRIQPPEGLTAKETQIWERLVEEKPANWFTRDNVELLKLYCRCAGQLDWITDRIAATKAAIEVAEAMNDLESLGTNLLAMTKFQNMENNYSKNMMAVATKLRMTPQAQLTPGVAATKAKQSAPKPYSMDETPVEDLYREISDDEGAGDSLMN